MQLRNIQLAAITMSVLASGAFAQTSFPEIEPNSNKANATAAGTFTLASGDSITGTTTGTTVTAGSTVIASVDTFRVRTATLPAGIYRHALTITTTGTAGHTGTIRGLSQVNGVITGTSDVAFQTSSAATSPARTNVWYGFGGQSEVYYRVAGTASTTAPYVSTLTTTTVTPATIAGTFNAGAITIASAVGQTTDTEIYLYDSTLTPIGHNDDPASGTGTGPSLLTMSLPAGTYYVGIADYNTGNNQSDGNPAEFYDDENLLDFPNTIANNNTVTAVPVSYTVSDGVTTTPVAATRAAIYEIVWGTFTVTGVVPPPANDNCAAAAPITVGATAGTLGTATNDGSASCDTGGGSSKDVWYTFTADANGGTLSLDTCGSTGIDTVVSVYASCGGAELACNDDCGGSPCGATNSCLSLALAANQAVTIRVSDKGLGGNNFVLNRTYVPNPPVNDSCASPIALAGPGLYGFSNASATTGTEGQTEAACLFFTFNSIQKDIWYSYTPSTNGTVQVTTCGFVPVPPSPNADTKIAIYAGTGCPVAGTAIACNDDAGTGTGSGAACTATGQTLSTTIEFAATCGVTYTIQLGMYGGSTSSAAGQFQVSETGGSACATPVTYYCFGDGTGTACPCANSGVAGNGCANSLNANGANLAASGIASITGDTWLLSGSGVPNGPGLYYQGVNQLGGGNGVTFGDGLRCVAGSVFRLGIVIASGNASTYPSPNPPAANQVVISVKGFNAAGDVRNYQLWYRDSDPSFCSASTFNLTNAVNVTWTP